MVGNGECCSTGGGGKGVRMVVVHLMEKGLVLLLVYLMEMGWWWRWV